MKPSVKEHTQREHEMVQFLVLSGLSYAMPLNFKRHKTIIFMWTQLPPLPPNLPSSIHPLFL